MIKDQVQPSLSDDLRQWVTENRLLGMGDEKISAFLADQGIDAGTAAEEIQALASHPYYRAAERLAKRWKKLESVLNVHRSLSSLADGARTVERRGRVSRAEFLEKYYAANRPVIFTGLMEDWPALTLWNPEYFKTKYGDMLVEAMAGRNQDPRPDLNLKAHRREIRFADYVDMVTSAGESNDVYLVSNNAFFRRPETQPLLEDIRFFDEHLDPAKSAGNVHLWFGPAGTVTSLHHDEMNIIMAQVYGRKRITLISPDETHRLYNERSVYSEVDCENPDYERHPDFREVQQLQVVLEPGEALFLPVGWWHHVRALDVSITVTFTNFVYLNKFDWWRPFVRR
jgi:ribosomal protein L16 Arg81 hydroxylase